MDLSKDQTVNIHIININAEQRSDRSWYDCGSYDLCLEGTVVEIIDDSHALVAMKEFSLDEEQEPSTAVFTKELRPMFNSFGTETGEVKEEWWADIADGAQIVFNWSMNITFEDLALLLKEAFSNKCLILVDHYEVDEITASEGLGTITITYDHTEFETNLYKELVSQITINADSISVYYRPVNSYSTDIEIKIYSQATTKGEYATTLSYLKQKNH